MGGGDAQFYRDEHNCLLVNWFVRSQRAYKDLVNRIINCDLEKEREREKKKHFDPFSSWGYNNYFNLNEYSLKYIKKNTFYVRKLNPFFFIFVIVYTGVSILCNGIFPYYCRQFQEARLNSHQ